MVRHPLRVVAAWLVVIAGIGGLGFMTNDGTSDDFTVPGTDSQSALDTLDRRFPELSGTSATILVRAPEGGSVRDAAVARGIEELVGEVAAEEHVAAVSNPLDSTDSPLVSEDGRSALIQVQLTVPLGEVTDADLDALTSAGQSLRDTDATVTSGGDAFNGNTPSISPTEILGLILALVVLFLLFRSLVASFLPVLSAVGGAAITIAGLMIATSLTPISATTPMLALMIGLAVGIDYALLVVAQVRENLSTGMEPRVAVAHATATAGTAVVFAGTTVAIALIALAVAGIPFLTTMGLGAALGVALAVAAALSLAPATSYLCRARLRPARRSARADERRRPGFLLRSVSLVTRRAGLASSLVVIALLILAAPASSLRLALPSGATAEKSSPQFQTYHAVSDDFGAGFNAPILVTADLLSSTDPVNDVRAIEKRLGRVDGVRAVTLATPNSTGDMGAFVVIGPAGPESTETADLVDRLRDAADELDADADFDIAVTGQTAVQIDVADTLADALVPYGIIVVSLSFALLAVAFRSWLMPLAAALGYLLSVFAALGLTTWVFVEGHGADWLHVQHVGPVIAFLPIILMGVLFGLAMDYQVFLVSRIWELRAHGQPPARAIEEGFARSAPIVIAAALIMIGVFAAFVPEGDAIIQPIAFALAVGVALDAFLVRLVLMPAILHLAGDRAWSFPTGLDRRLPHIDIEGASFDAERPQREGALTLQDATLLGSHGPVFEHVTFTVDDGRIGVITGDPGSGKTLALLALAGRAALSEGSVRVDGHSSATSILALQRRVALTEMAPVTELDDGLSVAQHVAEALASTRLRPWVSTRAAEREIAEFNAWVRQILPGPDPLDASVSVEELDPLQRRLLSWCLAQMGRPSVIVLDDVDDLRTESEQRAIWCLALASTHAVDPHRHATVVLAMRELPAFAEENEMAVLSLHPVTAER